MNLEEMRTNYKTSVDGWRHVYEAYAEDMKMVYDIDDAYWPANVVETRGKNRPRITVNKLLKFVRSLRSNQLINQASMNVIPADAEGSKEVAEIYDGLIRQIEYSSTSSTAIDTAFMNAVSGSVGFLRLDTDFVKGTFDQEIVIKRIINVPSVHLDPSAVEFTYSDGKWGFIETSYTEDQFEAEWPDAEKKNFEQLGTSKDYGDWFSKDTVRIAEYFYKDFFNKEIAQVMDENGIISIVEVTKENPLSRIKEFFEVLQTRKYRDYKVKWAKVSGAEILEEGVWPGSSIPIIPVFGDEVVVDGKKHFESLIRGAKGLSQMYSYWASAATENVALTPKAPFIVDHREVKDYTGEWDEAHLTNRMYMRYNDIGLGRPQRQTQTTIPAGIMSMMQTTANDIEDYLGKYESSKGQTSNERSGKAIEARIEQSDKSSHVFVDNALRSLMYLNQQIIEIIPIVYDTHRMLMTVGDTGESSLVNVNSPSVDDHSGNAVIVNNLKGNYRLNAKIGVSYNSQREEMVTHMLESMQYAPNHAHIIAPYIFKYSDWPGANEIYNELKQETERQRKMQELQNTGRNTAK